MRSKIGAFQGMFGKVVMVSEVYPREALHILIASVKRRPSPRLA